MKISVIWVSLIVVASLAAEFAAAESNGQSNSSNTGISDAEPNTQSATGEEAITESGTKGSWLITSPVSEENTSIEDGSQGEAGSTDIAQDNREHDIELSEGSQEGLPGESALVDQSSTTDIELPRSDQDEEFDDPQNKTSRGKCRPRRSRR